MTEQKEGYKQAVRNFRERYQFEMENNLRVLVEIRDDKESGPKNRSDAAYRIARMLGGLATDRVEPTKDDAMDFDDLKLSPEEQAEMEEFIGEKP